MVRPTDPQRKAELLERCFAAALEGDSLELSLAALAEGAGTSARMLVYHFGSREGLERALVERLEEALRQQFAALEAAAPGTGPRAATLAIWDALTQPAMRGMLRMSMDVLHRAQRGDPAARETAAVQAALWEGFLAPRLAGRSEAAAALFLLVLGAAMDYLVSGDAERGRRALAAYLDAVVPD